jgi:hypothetical protein
VSVTRSFPSRSLLTHLATPDFPLPTPDSRLPTLDSGLAALPPSSTGREPFEDTSRGVGGATSRTGTTAGGPATGGFEAGRNTGDNFGSSRTGGVSATFFHTRHWRGDLLHA